MRVSTLTRGLRNRWVVAVLTVIVLLAAVRAALPFIVTHYVNRTLNQIEGYDAGIDDVDIHLWRGAYAIHGLSFRKLETSPKTGAALRIPVFTVDTINLAVEWGELMRGALVGQVELLRPTVNILPGPAKKEEGRTIDDFIRQFRELTPLRVNRLAVIDGKLHFRNYAAEPDVNIYLHDIDLVVRNLTNSANISERLAATMSGTARAMTSGDVHVEMKFDPFEKKPTYDLAAELKNLSLPELNSYLRYYLGVVARDGTLSLYAESTARDGWFRGYVKPIVKNLDVLKIKQEKKTAGETIKAFFVKILANVFENKAKDQLATKIEFSGRFDDPQIGVWQAVLEFLRNAFTQGLPSGLEGSVAPAQAGKPKPGGTDPKDAEEQRKTREERKKLEEK